MANYIETEIKLRLADLEAVVKQLEQVEGKLVKPRVFERNVRYENAERSLTPSGIVIRLRHDTQNWLTFKSPGEIVGGGIRSRFEAEVEVSDFDTMETILGQLGYYPYMTYEKYRTTYAVESPVGEAEVVLDEMPYGDFVEIEGEPTVIEMVVSYLDLHNAPRYSASYTTLFDYVRHHLQLHFQDLTFANFEGIAVPGSAFLPPDEG